ncbi:MAG TPA: CDP-alcohol phosphatidyltransferase family protein, partial [Bacteroidota bacterium]|nr:CDP-alcohol phosphatidyltransferase family protein [Bacteroidota bacterium]
ELTYRMPTPSDKILGGLIRVAHEKLGLTPNQISTIGFAIGLVSAGVFAAGHILPGLLVMALCQVVDGVDGGVARVYNLGTEQGKRLDTLYDRLNELAIFLALAYAGQVTWLIAILAFVAILLVTAVEPLSKFDPGFKRFMLYFGYLLSILFSIRGFQIALNVVFFANLTAFAVGTIMVDYRLQAKIDDQEIIRRERELAMGLPPPPQDPPSLLSRIFA